MSGETIEARIDTVGNLEHCRPADLPKGAAMIIVFKSNDDCREALQHPDRVKLVGFGNVSLTTWSLKSERVLKRGTGNE
jgi:nucleoid DNA-binding protein